MIIAIIFLLLVSLFFSGSETALTAANKMKLQMKASQNDKKAEKLLELISKPSEFITSILIGNNLANIILPTLVTTLAIQYGFNVGLATAILTVIVIIFAEVIPKSIAATFPDRVALLVYPVIRFFIIVFKPLTFVLNSLTGFITKALSKDQPSGTSISKEELRTMVDIADIEGTFNRAESHRIKSVLDFYSLNVKDALKTPRVEILAFPHTASFEEVRDVIIQSPFSRYPVYKEDIDNIVAVFHSKQLITWSMEPDKPMEAFCDTDPLFVHESHSIEWVLNKMTKEKKHMAIVLEEYGGTEGIITHEDVIEAMLGVEIEDETDLEGESLVEKLTATEIICDGKIPLHRLNTIFYIDIPEEEDVLAGYLLKELIDFPVEGQVIELNNLTFHILKIEDRSIRKVKIIK